MVLSEEIKKAIEEDYNNWKETQYNGLSLEERQEMDMFYTPASITIKMIESFDCEDLKDKTILDPCCGSGNLLAACLIAGADSKNIYGNEYDKDMVEVCRDRLNKLCQRLGKDLIPLDNLHQGDATKKRALIQWGNKKVKDETCRKEEEAENVRQAQLGMGENTLW